MSLIINDETNSIIKFENLQNFFEENIEQCKFRICQYVNVRFRFNFI
jgi:hypothetical protein